MDCVRSYFDKNEPLTSWTLFSSLFGQTSTDLAKLRKKVFNWSDAHLERSNFLRNPYFNCKKSSAHFWVVLNRRKVEKIDPLYVAWFICGVCGWDLWLTIYLFSLADQKIDLGPEIWPPAYVSQQSLVLLSSRIIGIVHFGFLYIQNMLKMGTYIDNVQS